ncbi:MAG: class F sortase [Dehalococcoidia bacterium]
MMPLRQWWALQTRATRWATGAAVLALVVLVGATAVMATAGSSGDGGPLVTVSAPSTSTPVGSDAPGPTHTAEPLPTEDPDLPTLETLREFVKEHGDPPSATLGRFKIPRIGVDAPIGERTVGADLNLQYLNPFGPSDVSWYNFEVDPRYGGDIDEGKNPTFAAHVDYAALVPYAQVNYRGEGVFRDINLLRAGDVIEVTMHGKTVRYEVVWKRQVPETEGDWGNIFSADVPEGDAITLITCSGDFNTVTREYDSRTVIRGQRVDA